MRLLATIVLLLLLGPAEPRRGPRSRAAESGAGGRVRGRGRAGVMRRQTQECKEYIEAGEKYLDCQDRQLTTVMQDWPKDIHHLLLARNKIQVQRVLRRTTSSAYKTAKIESSENGWYSFSCELVPQASS